jgi:glycerol-3-phosphate dehydrogenase
MSGAPQRVDLAVVGAGIHGAAVAAEATRRRLKVAVVERSAPAAGTSSRSSKLIHGGLRYLEQGRIDLVRESLAARRQLLREAPDLVELAPFLLPVYAGAARAPLTIRAGLALYWLLSLPQPTPFSTLAPHEWPSGDGLRTAGLRALFRYYDGMTDDAALTRRVLAGAAARGAMLLCPASVDGITLGAEGVALALSTPAGPRELQARAVVNAAGPWLTEVIGRVAPRVEPPAVELVRGSHVELPSRALAGTYLIQSPRDARPMFVIPRGDHTLVGTTEVRHEDGPDQVEPSPLEHEYLLEAVAAHFPGWAAEGGLAVRASWAGLRLLPAAAGGLNARSRETQLHVDRPDRPRLLSIVGGKLTTHAATARECLARLAPAFD